MPAQSPFMLRIDVEHAGSEYLVVLHGWLAGEEVAVFETSCASLDLPVPINLANLAGADTRGLQALHGQRERGARITGASPYIELLTGGGSRCDGRGFQVRRGPWSWTVFYRLANGGRKDNPATLDLLVGARYYGTSAQLNATFPYLGEMAGDKKDLSWTDALAGLRFRAPLGSRAAFLGRADVAGFGSKVTWNLTGDLAVGVSERWTVGAGWRYMDIDYEKGSGPTRSVLNLAYNGPRPWFAYAG